MGIITFLITNWDSVLIVIAFCVLIIIGIKRGETTILKQILFSLVTKAEQEFGTNVGVLKYAYVAAVGQYVKIEEMPSGKGIADIVYIPTTLSRLPAMVIELKWNKTSGGAISQIKEKEYTAALKPYAGNLLLVGINYNDKTGEHTCLIERH